MQKIRHFHRVTPAILQGIIYLFSLTIFKLFARIKYEGVENVINAGKNGQEPLIFAANHSSEWDGTLIRVGLPYFWAGSPMYYVSQVKEFYIASGWRKMIYGGTLFNLLGAYPVYSGHHDYAYSLQNYFHILNHGGNVCIFPEGVRTKTGELGRAHGGVAFLASQTGTTVIPVAISGLVRFKVGDFFLGRRRVVIRYGKPMLPREIVPAETPTVDDYKAGGARVMAKIAERL